jgi:hypothetical protein
MGLTATATGTGRGPCGDEVGIHPTFFAIGLTAERGGSRVTDWTYYRFIAADPPHRFENYDFTGDRWSRM